MNEFQVHSTILFVQLFCPFLTMLSLKNFSSYHVVFVHDTHDPATVGRAPVILIFVVEFDGKLSDLKEEEGSS